MAKSKIKSKVRKAGINHLKSVNNNTDNYDNAKAELYLSQYQSFDTVLDFFHPKQTSQQFMLLTGSAGTGKTFLVGCIAEYLKKQFFCNILLCAPINKAVKVLKKAQAELDGVSFMTIHGALGLREEIDDDGNQIFVNRKVADVKITNYDYVMVDEASMIDTDIFTRIYDAIEYTNIKVLFIGDKFQIPPVNYSESAVFMPKMQAKYNITETELRAIIRQKAGHPIISFANQLKDELDNAQIVSKLIRLPEFKDNEQLILMPQTGEALIPVLKQYFLTNDFDIDADYCKVLAYHNRIVIKFNTLIRKLKYGENVSQLMVGEKIIFDRPWLEARKIHYTTNEEATVRSFTEKSMNLFDREFLYYETMLSKEGSNVIEKRTIRILKDESRADYLSVKRYLAGKADSYKRGTPESRGWWSTWYQFRDKFAEIKYNYAITVHKSQGSTYANIIIANYDINDNPRIVERNRIKYTALTRAEDKVYLIV